jgi:hypothetical protein
VHVRQVWASLKPAQASCSCYAIARANQQWSRRQSARRSRRSTNGHEPSFYSRLPHSTWLPLTRPARPTYAARESTPALASCTLHWTARQHPPH